MVKKSQCISHLDGRDIFQDQVGQKVCGRVQLLKLRKIDADRKDVSRYAGQEREDSRPERVWPL